MLMKKYIISLLTVVFVVVGCDSNSKNLESTTNVITEETAVKLSKPVMVETKPSNWYIRLIAEDPARKLKSSSSQLGELEENDAVQAHALKALTSFSRSYLDIVFVNPNGVVSGDYKSNFHVYAEDREDQWSFTVKTDDPNAEIRLSWQGLYILNPYVDEQGRIQYKEYRSVTNPLIKYMKLVDSVNGNEIAAMSDGRIKIYSFNMNGQNERIFKWVVQNEEVMFPAQTNHSLEIKDDISIVKKQIIRKKSEIFDLSKPPVIK